MEERSNQSNQLKRRMSNVQFRKVKFRKNRKQDQGSFRKISGFVNII